MKTQNAYPQTRRRLKYLELWQIRGLSDISVVSSLSDLQYLFLQALRNVDGIPDLSRLTRLRKVSGEHAGQLRSERRPRMLATCGVRRESGSTVLVETRSMRSERNYQLGSETENTMSHSISTLLLRNLSDVFGENDPMRRRAAIDEIFHEDAVFYDPKGGEFRGRDEIDRIAGVLEATHPDFKYRPLFPPEELGDAGRVRWVSGTPGKRPAYAGTDFIVARNGRIASIYLFFDSLP